MEDQQYDAHKDRPWWYDACPYCQKKLLGPQDDYCHNCGRQLPKR